MPAKNRLCCLDYIKKMKPSTLLIIDSGIIFFKTTIKFYTLEIIFYISVNYELKDSFELFYIFSFEQAFMLRNRHK